MSKNLSELKKRSLSSMVEPILNKDSNHASGEAAHKLCLEAKEYNIGLDDFFRLAVDFEAEEETKKMREAGMDGFEMALAKMNLPLKNNFKQQITLAQASDTFATYTGTRSMFPYVIDNMVRWEDRLDVFERSSDLIASSRNISGNELVRIVGKDDKDARQTFQVAEGGRIPVRTVRSGEKSVKIWKHGSALELTYEFERRAALELIAPFAARIARDLDTSKARVATAILLNGDGENGAATDYSQATLDTSATDGKISYDGLLSFLTARAKLGVPVTTLAGDYEAYMQFIKLFTPNANVQSEADALAGKGGPSFTAVRNIFAPVQFVLNTHVPAGKLLGFNKAETLEELVEAGSRIQEEERAMLNQTITYAKTENTGYSLIYGDTRATYTFKR